MQKAFQIDVKEDITLITFNKVPSDLLFVSQIFTEFGNAKLNIDMISQTAPCSGYVSISFTAEGTMLRSVLDITAKFREKFPSMKPLVSSGNCKITISSDLMRENYGIAAKVFSVLSQAQVDLLLITTSESEISLLISQSQLFRAQAALEEAFA